MIRKLTNMPYGQAVAITDEYGAITLRSYATDVITIDPMGWLTCTGLYSMTTRRHISAFLKEYAPAISFQDVKLITENHQTINIYTGEVCAI